MAGLLYVVSTPIGNPEDLTFRALRVLRDVQWIAAEHPDRTKPLLDHYAVETPVTSYHTLNKEEKTSVLITRLLQEQNIALVSDAGTPAIFDPGSLLIARAIAARIRVVPVPGPCAPVAAISGSGAPSDGFIIQGFLPTQTASLRRFLQYIRTEERALVLLVRHHCLRSTLETFRPVLGRRRLTAAKNLTMPDEEFLRGTVTEVLAQIHRHPLESEWTLVIEGVSRRARRKDDRGQPARFRITTR